MVGFAENAGSVTTPFYLFLFSLVVMGLERRFYPNWPARVKTF